MILLIFVIPIVYGENFDGYKELTLDFEINSGLNLIIDQGGKLDSISADLKLVPIENSNQEILDIDIYSSPEAVIEDEETVRYLWNDLNNKYIFGIKARVKVMNNIAKVRSRIRFPYDFENDFSEYIVETEFIDINEDIRREANEILKGESDYYKAVFKLSDWVKTNIDYDLNTLTAEAVIKSSWVLENRQGVCDELTNLFISMLRAVGIPARFVTGMVYTSIDDGWGNHGWAEVYFPNKGWVSWDVTFGQFGWVDPSHIKLSDTPDSGESSVNYRWRSNNIEVSADDLVLKTELFEKGEKFDPLVKIQINPYKEKAKFGSYLPIVVDIENLQDYYLSDSIILLKGPKVDDNVQSVLLKPREIKSVYWITKVPDDLDDDFVYTSVLEVRDSFASFSRGEVLYSKDGSDLDFEEASLIVNKLVGREEKDFLMDVVISCEDDERSYYSDEEIDILCGVRNVGNVLLENLNFCLDSDCELGSLGIGESREFSYSVDAKENILYLVESNNFIRKENLRFDIINTPKIHVTDIVPSEVDYNVETDVNFFINSDFEAKNVFINVNNVFNIEYDSLVGKESVQFTINSKKLVSGLNLDISYEDSSGRRYDEMKSYPIVVKNVPFYARWLGALRDLV